MVSGVEPAWRRHAIKRISIGQKEARSWMSFFPDTTTRISSSRALRIIAELERLV